ncbi:MULTISPECIES: MFS transporter [unclassified Pseudoxanthomonas]|uniref:NTP/NDP exchange transporter n=1 Tax=unclassified Pseudoxanthomonas TaxID=2645906 RepID=UPI0016152DF9|nr:MULTISPECIES: MFS transporter [unclassified Pseudoxanthomonas]MBB3274483.1 AAA family ATP:ADP antiporter [Pseudoxanthomonas sp. OG2]MBV7474989.1 MFS transporter [Pseudoxanthomonas sp. PXM05]UBB27080.1 MFS transporter [Pseudoxanthomonas japonensis]
MSDASPRPNLIARLFNVEPRETAAVVAGLALFFLLFTGYFMLRPVRETMGVAGGVDNLQWLFTGTFVATLAAMPLFGWVAARVRRRHILPWTFGFFVLNLLVFAALFAWQPENVWIARTFYIWLSVFNLLTISLAWSVLADLFVVAQAKRLFALMAGGASLGGLFGPILGTLLVAPLGHAGLVLLSALFLAGSIAAANWLQRWRDAHPLPIQDGATRSRPLGGNPFAGATAVFRSPYLLGIALFVLLLASVSTFLYFEQARLVAEVFPDRTRQTQVFGLIDTIVQSLAILTQIFITGQIARRLGVGILLVLVPLITAAGFLWLALAPTFAVFAVVMVVRRAGEYALVRPGREMLYTVVGAEDKYKAKNFIDTVVYRGADALSGWVKRMLDLVAEHPALAMFIGAGIALVWAGNGAWLGRAQRRREQAGA